MKTLAYAAANLVRFIHGALVAFFVISLPLHFAVTLNPAPIVIFVDAILFCWVTVALFSSPGESNCPLTIAENWLWQKADMKKRCYKNSCINHYVFQIFGWKIKKGLVGGTATAIAMLHTVLFLFRL